MKNILFPLFFLLFLACSKEEKNPVVLVDSSVLSGFRGDTITLKTENIDVTNVQVILSNNIDGVTKKVVCQKVSAEENTLSFIVSDSILYNSGNSFPELTGFDLPLLIIQQNNTILLQKQFTILFNPEVSITSSPQILNANDSIKISGHDLDIKTLSIMFNSIPGKIVKQNSRELVVLAPDSCGSGNMHVSYYDYYNDYEVKDLFIGAYNFSFNGSYKNPKRVKMIWDEGNMYYTYNLEFNTFNKLSRYDLLNLVGDLYGHYQKFYFYNNNQDIFFSKTTINGEFHQLDSIFYKPNKIIEKIYRKKTLPLNPNDTLQLFWYANYFLDSNNRIIESEFYSSQNNELREKRSYNFYQPGKCKYKRTEYNTPDHSFIFEYDICYDENFKIPLQMKTMIEGLAPTLSNDLDYILFPGNIISMNRIGYGEYLDIDLYYNSNGNIVKEEHYRNSELDYNSTKTRSFSRRILWEY